MGAAEEDATLPATRAAALAAPFRGGVVWGGLRASRMEGALHFAAAAAARRHSKGGSWWRSWRAF